MVSLYYGERANAAEERLPVIAVRLLRDERTSSPSELSTVAVASDKSSHQGSGKSLVRLRL
jgi:hypothetical protein